MSPPTLPDLTGQQRRDRRKADRRRRDRWAAALSRIELPGSLLVDGLLANSIDQSSLPALKVRIHQANLFARALLGLRSPDAATEREGPREQVLKPDLIRRVYPVDYERLEDYWELGQAAYEDGLSSGMIRPAEGGPWALVFYDNLRRLLPAVPLRSHSRMRSSYLIWVGEPGTAGMRSMSVYSIGWLPLFRVRLIFAY